MKFVEITSSEIWDAFHTRHAWSQFTQSWAWGEFRRATGCKIRRMALIDPSGQWLLAAQFEYRAKRVFGGFWFSPRGPVFSDSIGNEAKLEAMRVMRQELSAAHFPCLSAGTARSLFIRVEPVSELGKPEGLPVLPFLRNKPRNPSSTVLVDLERSREEIQSAMKQKTRYNIRVADRHGITTRVATHPSDVTAFLDLHEKTAARDRFTAQDRNYLADLYKNFEPKGLARIRLAERGEILLAGSMEILYGRTATYLHGASSSEGKNLMAPYALHWDAIMHAKRDGSLIYDFWGVNPASKAAFAYKDSWEGISRFKLGWGGRLVDLVGTWDFPIHPIRYFIAFPRQWWNS
ncbi:MAG: peptidoglycan bridge formation glycyltransferase FemA/FemB family protein [Patescibacteria group bacterium]